MLLQIESLENVASEAIKHSAGLGAWVFILLIVLLIFSLFVGGGAYLWFQKVFLPQKQFELQNRVLEAENKKKLTDLVASLVGKSTETHGLVVEIHGEMHVAKKITPIAIAIIATLQKHLNMLLPPDKQLDLSDFISEIKGILK